MKINFYPITIEEHEEGGYHAKCSAMQGAWADGDTIEEVIDNLKSIMQDILAYQKMKARRVIKFDKNPAYHGLALAV